MNPVIQQIQALLQKTVENGCTEAEATTAAAVAQKLISKHQLAMADIQESVGEFGKHFTDGSLESASRLSKWKRYLLAAICQSNGCISCMVAGPRKSMLVVLGTEADATIVKFFYPSLRDLVDAAAKRDKPPGAGATWLNSFRLGMVAAISRRLISSRSESEATATSTALVRVKDQSDALTKWVEQDLKIKEAPRRASSVLADAFEKGVTQGQSFNLSTKALAE